MISVLYVDDEPALLELTRLFLERNGDIRVTAEQSAVVALDLIKQMHFDVIVSDYLMPQMDGLEFLKIVTPDHPDISFILFTGKGREEIAIEAINNGASFYLQKGGDPRNQYNELIQKIHIVVDKKRAQEELLTHNLEITAAYEQLLSIGENLNQTIKQLETSKLDLYEEKQLLRLIIDAAPFGVILCQPDQENRLIVIDSNESASHLLSFPIGDHHGDDIRNIFHLVSQGDLYEQFLTIAREGGRFDVDQIPLNQDVQNSVFEVHALQMKPDRLLIFFRDITVQINAEIALVQSEEKYRVLVDTSQDGVFIVQNGNIVYANPAFASMIGFTQSDLVGISFVDVIAPEDREKVKYQFSNLSNRETVLKSYEFNLLHYNGLTRIISQMNAGIISYRGILSITGSIRDITEIRMAEDALNTSEQNYQRVIENITDVFYRTDNHGTIILVSPSAAKMLRCPPEQPILGTPVTTYWYQPEKRYDMLDLMDLNGYVQDYEMTVLCCDGSSLPASVSASFYYNGHGEIAGIEEIVRDISERKRAESAIRLVNTKLILLSSITRHDILNKLTVILGYLDELKDNSEKPEQILAVNKLEEYANAILQQVEFTRLYQNLGSNSPMWQNISDLFARILPQIDARAVRIEVDVDELEIYADPLLERAIYNLIENAIRHGEFITRIKIQWEMRGSDLCIIISDDGKGISESDKKHVFNQGFGKNTGLGLFLTREILSITSISIIETGVYGEGARFELTIPYGSFRHTNFISLPRKVVEKHSM